MNILIITGHPAQVHNFKHVKNELENKNHNVFWLASHKDISKYLLDCYNINYSTIIKPGKSYFSKATNLIRNSLKTIRFIRKNKIDLIISRVSPYGALASKLTGTVHFAMADTESSGIYDSIFSKMSSVLFTAKSYRRNLRKDQIRFDSNIELFYLHPNRFKPMSRKEVADLLSIKEDEKYIIMRFVSWDAYHDKGLSGFTDTNKIKAAELFSKHARVFITSESKLIPELEKYRIKIAPEKMHDVMAHSLMFFGESATMASESAVLGTAGVFLDKIGRGYTDEEGEYDLVFNYNNDASSQSSAIHKGIELLQNPDLKKLMKVNHHHFLKNKIDATAFFVWFIDNYPKSKEIIKEDPNYQYNFK